MADADKASEKNELDRNGDSLVWISSVSSFVSWLVLVVFVGLVSMTVYGTFASGGQLGLDLNTLYTVLNWLLLLSIGLGMFLLLQAVSKGIWVLLDLQDHVCPDDDDNVEVVAAPAAPAQSEPPAGE